MTASFMFSKNRQNWLFWHFWWIYVHSKCKRSSLRSQCATVFFYFQTPCCRCRFQDDDDKHIIKRDHFHLCRFSPIEARNSKSFMVFLPQRFPCHWRLRNDFRSGLGMHAKMWTNGRRRIFAKVKWHSYANSQTTIDT